jgi:hypothetical protein
MNTFQTKNPKCPSSARHAAPLLGNGARRHPLSAAHRQAGSDQPQESQQPENNRQAEASTASMTIVRIFFIFFMIAPDLRLFVGDLSVDEYTS